MSRFVLLLFCLFLFPLSVVHSASLESDMAKSLTEGRRVVTLALAKSRSGQAPATEFARLKGLRDELAAIVLLQNEQSASVATLAAKGGGRGAERHHAVSDALGKALNELLTRFDVVLANGDVAALEELLAAINRLQSPKARPLHGTLPYRQTAYAPGEPATAPAITPAYRGGTQPVADADTAPSPEAPLSAAIVAHAQSLQWNPVLIYEWMKNNVSTEWYFGVMKGAEETLKQKSGNDADQAALLVALLRASGFPSRFVRGTIELFPDLNKAVSLTGINDPQQILLFLQKAGIPCKPVIAGGRIVNFQLEHIWVESQIPYSNYRGAVIDGMGKTWLGLDTSIKPHGLDWNSPPPLPESLFVPLRDDYLQSLHSDTPLEFVRLKVEAYLLQNGSAASYQDLLGQGSIIPDVLKILPASLQFKQIAITGEYVELPAELRHSVRFTARTDSGNELFSQTLETYKLLNRKLVMTYEPETVEDQQTIDSFGGLGSTPPYLVRLRPALTLDGERLIVAQDGLSMGSGFTLDIDIATPNGTERITSGQINGNLVVIGVGGGSVATPVIITAADDAQTILHKEAIGYIARWNKGEEELASLLGQRISRPSITIAIVGNQVEVTTLLDTPHGVQWKGVYLDAGYRRVATAGNEGARKQFMQLSALQGSVLEHRIFEDDLKVDSISTAKLLQQVRSAEVPVVIIDKANIDTSLPVLSLDTAVTEDIVNAINQGLTVSMPQSETAYRDWSGIGYIKENAATGEAGWMLSGQVAGGMTAVGRGKWSRQDLVARLTAPTRVSSDLWSTGQLRVRSLGDNGNIALMQAIGSFDADNPDRSITQATRQAVAREYFKTHGDVDFLVILSTFDYALPAGDAQGFYTEAKNDIRGIGRELFDYSTLFGSSGRLQGTIDLGNITPGAAVPAGETLEETITTLSHELGHRFGAYVRLKNPDGTLNTALLGKDNAHWNYLLDTNGSLLYGNGWQANPDGTYTATSVRNSYSQLDLYLMGLIPPEQVPPMLRIDNQSIDRTKLPHLGDTVSGIARTVTINDIIAAEGPRIPAAADSPKTFTIGYVLLKRPGDDIAKAAQAAELLRKGFAGRLTELTQSKGSVSGIGPEVALYIETPAEGAVITGPDVTVSGNVANTTGGTETGVAINGIPATVSGSRFIANHVPLMDGANTITVTATDANGLTTTTTRTVTAQAGHYIRISSNIESGTAPLEFSLRLDGTIPLEDAILRFPDTPAVNQLETVNPEDYGFRITEEGTYEFAAEVTDQEGQIYRDTMSITVVAKEKLDSLLKAKWEGMRAALFDSDIPRAVVNFSEYSKDIYQQQFIDLSASLPKIADGMSEIALVKVEDNIAEYDMRDLIYGVEYSFYLLFVKGRDGMWKIRNF